ncbi:unnamed protein product [Sphagnum troendelagicum]|uniref:Uncharacterized protein n=1 Tax=Sphagnum troendelagicum TaxID=128251 RepID=A0ABP0V0R5_9BRYO
MTNVSQKFEMMKTDKTGQDRQADFERLAMQGRSNFSFTLGRILDTVDIREKQASTHARTRTTGRDRRGGTYTTDLDAACLLPKLLKFVSAIVKKKTRFDDVHACV